MRNRNRKGIAFTALAPLLAVSFLGGDAVAEDRGTTLEPLLKAADFEKIGLKGVVLAPLDAYDRTEQLGFERAFDSTLVLTLARLAPSGPGGTLRSALEIISKEVTPVSGVGDEAYSYLGGLAFAFRKGTATFQMMSGLDVSSGAKPFLTQAHLAQLAKVVCGRL